MTDTAAQLEACKAAASVRDTDLTATQPIGIYVQGLALTLIAELPITIADCYYER